MGELAKPICKPPRSGRYATRVFPEASRMSKAPIRESGFTRSGTTRVCMDEQKLHMRHSLVGK